MTDEELFLRLIRLCRTRWYIDYRRWDMTCLYMLRARQGIGMPEPDALNEDGAKLVMNLKVPYDLLSAHIQNGYANNPDFDRFFYYPSDQFGAAEKVIDGDGIKKIDEQIRSDFDTARASAGEWFTKEYLRNECAFPSSLMPEMGCLQEVEADGRTLVRLPEFPTPPEIWDLLENNELPEHPDDYLFL